MHTKQKHTPKCSADTEHPSINDCTSLKLKHYNLRYRRRLYRDQIFLYFHQSISSLVNVMQMLLSQSKKEDNSDHLANNILQIYRRQKIGIILITYHQSPTLHTFTLKGGKLFGCHVVHYMLVGSFCVLCPFRIPVLSNSSLSWMYSFLHSSKKAGSL